MYCHVETWRTSNVQALEAWCGNCDYPGYCNNSMTWLSNMDFETVRFLDISFWVQAVRFRDIVAK
jgi:hypothetical protein